MFNLINILGQNTLPEQVEINKQNIAILADEVEKLGYQPKGLYDAETEYNHNDVVFYDNKLYVVTSDAAIVGVLPTNTTYWQQVTGDMRGQQGAQGPQGEQGEAGAAGADGLNALEFAQLLTVSTIGDVGTLSLQVSEANFNRQTIQYEHFNCYGKDSNNKVYLFDAQVARAGQHGVPASQAQISLNLATKFLISGENGADGATGKSALVYGRKINFIWNGETEQLLSGLSLSFQDFNRVPELNEDFVVILHDTLYAVDYLAMGEIQTKSNLNVTSIVATDINRITGQNGQNGTNGTDGTNGKDALVCSAIYQPGTNPSQNQYISLNSSYYNRTPVINEYYPLIWKGANNRSFVCMMKVNSVPGAVSSQVISYLETTGAQGASLSMQTNLNDKPTANASNRSLISSLLNNCKGRIYWRFALSIGTNDMFISPEVYATGNTIYLRSVVSDNTNLYAYEIGMPIANRSYKYKVYNLTTSQDVSNNCVLGKSYTLYWNDTEITA